MDEKNKIELIGKKNGLISFFPKWGKTVILVALSISFVLGAVIIVYGNYLAGESKRLESERLAVAKRIADIKPVEDAAFALKQKIRVVSSLIGQRPDFAEKLKFFNLLSDSVILDKVSIKELNKFELTGRAPNALLFSRFLTELREKDSAEFDRAVLLSSSRINIGEYSFVIQLTKDARVKK